jgi:citrate synthase
MVRGTTGEAIEELAERVERLMLSAKSLKPNLDWPAARVYHALGLPVQVFTPIFVVARMSGWTAHVIEQIGDNRLIRPLSLYTGHEERHVAGYVPDDAAEHVSGRPEEKG